jgi:hypothetical protein
MHRERRYAYRVWCGNMRERGYLEDIGVDGNINCIFKMWDGETWAGLI